MINLVDEFYLDADEKQFILVEWTGAMYYDKSQKKEVPKYGKTLYFTSFFAVLDRLALILQRRGIARSTTLIELRDEFVKTKQIIEQLAEQMNPTYESVGVSPREPAGRV